ncbi:MAG: O-antigen ligase family protein [Candidatus Berkelbacteria bacterium]|nr:O-antigen ligase family protein [Candidatus Berkelbacteria bacterium]
MEYLISACLFLIPAYIFRLRIFGVPTNVFEVAVGVLFLAFVVARISRHFRPDRKSTTVDSRLHGNDKPDKIQFGFSAALAVLFFAAAGVAVAADKTRALGIFKGWFLIPALLYFVIINIKPKIKTLVLPLFLSLLIVSVWTISQKIGLISTLFYQVGDSGFSDYIARARTFGPFESPNYLAMFLLPMMFATLPILTLAKKKTDKLLIFSLYLLPLFALYASHSLGGLLAFAVGSVGVIAFSLVKIFKSRFAGRGWAIVGLAVALIVVAVGFALVFSSIGHEVFDRSIRIDIYNYAITLIKSHPVFGIGLGQFQDSVRQISAGNLGFTLYGLAYALHPHNLFLAFWLYTGGFGFLAFITLLGNFFWNLARRRGDIIILAGSFAAMLAILVHGLVDTTYFKNDLSAVFWVLLAISMVFGSQNQIKN